MKSVGKSHLWKKIFIRRDETSEGKSSLGEDFFRRDEISVGKSSLGEDFYPQR